MDESDANLRGGVHGRIVPWFRSRVKGWGGLFRLPPDDDPQQGLKGGRGHAHGRRARDGPDGIRDGAIFRLVRGILPEARSAAHPHVHHDRLTVPGDGTGEGVSLEPAQAVEAFRDAPIRRDDVRAQTLRRDALRVLRRLRLIVRPRHTGREGRHDASRRFEAPSGGRAEGFSERARLIVPTLGSAQVEQRSLREQRDEGVDGSGADGGVAGGGGVHACIVPSWGGGVKRGERNIHNNLIGPRGREDYYPSAARIR